MECAWADKACAPKKSEFSQICSHVWGLLQKNKKKQQSAVLFGLLKGHKGIIPAVCFRVMTLASSLCPDRRIDRGEVCIAIKTVVDARDNDTVDQRQGLFVDLSATDDKGRQVADQGNRFFQGADSVDIVVLPVFIAGDNDIAAVGQGASDRVECLPAHDDRMSGCGAFKVCQILGQVPGKGIANANAGMIVGGNNNRNVR